MSKTKVHLEDTGERLIVDGHEKSLTYGEHLARYLSVLKIVKGKRVLDIASGSGYGTRLISEYAKQVYGVDNSEQAVEYSRKHFNSENIEYLVGDAEKIPLEDDSLDVVVSFETIEHLSHPQKFLNEVKRVLSQEGALVVSTPNAQEFMKGNEFHQHEFSLAELKKLLLAHFKNVDFWYEGSWFSAGVMSEKNFVSAVSRINLPATKTFEQPPKKASFFIAVASDSRLPKLEEEVVIADTWSLKEDLARDKVRTENVARLEVEIRNLTQQKDELENSYRDLAAHMEAIRNTRGYKLLEKTRKIVGPIYRLRR